MESGRPHNSSSSLSWPRPACRCICSGAVGKGMGTEAPVHTLMSFVCTALKQPSLIYSIKLLTMIGFCLGAYDGATNLSWTLYRSPSISKLGDDGPARNMSSTPATLIILWWLSSRLMGSAKRSIGGILGRRSSCTPCVAFAGAELEAGSGVLSSNGCLASSRLPSVSASAAEAAFPSSVPCVSRSSASVLRFSQSQYEKEPVALS